MGSKYTTQSASGYNSSPPSDDGSQTASNLIKWSSHKTKLADPIKTLADNINSALVTALDYSVRQITSSDSVAATDHMKTVEFAPTSTSGLTLTLADAATMTTNFLVRVKNSSAHDQTIGRTTSSDTIDGTAANITIPSKSAFILSTTTGADGYLLIGKYGLDINSLTEDTTPDLAADYVETYDASASGSKKVLLGRLGAGVLGTEQASTSGTSIDFTGIPSWAKRIHINLVGVSTNGTSNPLIQIGDSGGIEATGYLGGSSHLPDSSAIVAANYTAGFGIASASAGAVLHGTITLTLEDSTGFTWVAHGVIANSASAACFVVAGSKSTSAALDRVRITTANGTDAFDAGAINILYE